MSIKEIEAYALKNDIPIIQSEGKDFLIQVIQDNRIKSILEIGSAIGYSAIVMAMLNQDIKIDSIERDLNRYQQAVTNVATLQLTSQINLINADALLFDENTLKQKYDLIFVDGAKAQSQKFIEKYEPLLNEKGIILIDNINFHGFASGERKTTNRNTRQLVGKINRFKDWILNNQNYESTMYQVGDGIIVARKK